MDITIESFAKELSEELKVSIPRRYGVTVDPVPQKIVKTNCEKQALIVFFEGSEAAPTVYLEEHFARYKNGALLKDIASEISDMVFNAHEHRPMVPELTAKEAAKHITLTLVNTARNEKMLEKVPHFTILGGELSAIPRWIVSENASFIVTNEMAGAMDLTFDEVLRIGKHNIDGKRFVAKSMHELIGDLPFTGGPVLWVLSSEEMINGANALLSEDALRMVQEKLDGDNYYILPSSIHEVICIPENGSCDLNGLSAMVREVNASVLEPDDFLSDRVMYYDGHELTLAQENYA